MEHELEFNIQITRWIPNPKAKLFAQVFVGNYLSGSSIKETVCGPKIEASYHQVFAISTCHVDWSPL